MDERIVARGAGEAPRAHDGPLVARALKFFGSTVSRGTRPVLQAALLERRRALEGKYGAAVAIARTLEALVELFECYWSKITGRR